MSTKMKRSRLSGLAIIVIISSLMLSCGKRNRSDYLPAEESFRKAMVLFEKGKYLDASESLTIITLNYSGSSIIDSAQYYLGECHYLMKEYIIAASEYERLTNQFPSSDLVDDAKYKIGLCYFNLSPHYGLEQEYSQKCIDEFQEFTEYYRDSELIPEVLEKISEVRNKIAKKTYKSGELYFKMHDYESAIIYFNLVLENYYDTGFAPKALFKKGASYLKMKQRSDAETAFSLLEEKYPDALSLAKIPALLAKDDLRIQKEMKKKQAEEDEDSQ